MQTPSASPTTSAPDSSASRRLLMWTIFIASALFSLGYGVTFLLPLLVEGFGGDEAQVGNILGVAMVSTLLAVLFAGHLSDRLGRARSVGFGGIALALAVFGLAAASDYGLHVLFYGLLLGAGWGLFYCLSQTLLALLIPPEERARMFLISHAFIMAGIGGGPLIGPLALAAGLSVSGAFYIVASCTLIAAGLFFWVSVQLGESTSQGENSASLTLASARRVMASESRYPIIMVGLGAAVFSGFHAYQVSFAAWAGVDYTIFFITYSLTVVLFRVALSGFMARVPLYAASAGLLCAMTAGSALFFVIDGSTLVYAVAAFLIGIGYGITYALIKTIVVNEAPQDVAPQAMQLFNLSYFVGIFGFPLVGGYLLVEVSVEAFLAVLTLLAAWEGLIAFRRHALVGRK